MKFEYFGKDYDISDLLKDITEKKCRKLDKYFKSDENALVRLNVIKEGMHYISEMTVVHKAQNYRAEAKGFNPFDNIDELIPRIIGQIRKQKDIWEKNKKD